jgi:phosphatidylglycerophosphatase C
MSDAPTPGPGVPPGPAIGDRVDDDTDIDEVLAEPVVAVADPAEDAVGALSTAEAPPTPGVTIGPEVPPDAGVSGPRGLAAFDFDGTLARQDTFVPFLRHACGNRRVALAAAAAARATRDRDVLKLAVLASLLRGWPEDRLAEAGRAYARRLPALLRPEMVARLRWHQEEGHRVVLVSASLGAYLRPLATALGLDAALAVEMEVGPSGLLTGNVEGGFNTRGPAKVKRLRDWLDQSDGSGAEPEVWAYGDSAGDEELLAYADHPTWVGRRAERPGRRARFAR